MIGGMQQLLCCEETLGKLGLSSLEQRVIRGDLMGVCQYLKGARRKMRERHFTKVRGDGIRGNSLTLKESMVRLDVRKEFFLGLVERPWHRLLSEAMAASGSLGVFNASLDGALSTLG